MPGERIYLFRIRLPYIHDDILGTCQRICHVGEGALGKIPGEGNVCGSTKHCCYKNSGKSHGSFVNESVSSKPIPYFENARLTI